MVFAPIKGDIRKSAECCGQYKVLRAEFSPPPSPSPVKGEGMWYLRPVPGRVKEKLARPEGGGGLGSVHTVEM
jgi:hypothetical protein